MAVLPYRVSVIHRRVALANLSGPMGAARRFIPLIKRRDGMIFGVDLRASPKRPSSVAALDSEGRLSCLISLSYDHEIIGTAATARPDIIAIGSPLSLPSGLCCLEALCRCDVANPRNKGRQAELELARMKISCFFTNKRSIIRALIYRGIKVAGELRRDGHEVIEVYPHASKVVLFGGEAPPKSSPGNLPFMRERLSWLVDGLDSHLKGLDRNRCDAILNAYTAFLQQRGEAACLGNEDEGWLVLPRAPSRETCSNR